MQFGMPTLIEIKSLDECAALCLSFGLSFIEINMNLPEFQVLETARFDEIAQKHGVYYTIHLDENLNPCDFNERVAAAYIETVLRTIGMAKCLHIPVLNMHVNPGVYFTLPDRKVFLYDEYEAEYLRKTAEFRNACAEAVGGADIKICIENCGGYARFPFIRKGIALLLESPVFALTFDTGHNAAAEYGDEPTIMEYTDRLRHMHLHDARGRSNHLMLGEGGVDLTKYLKLAEAYDCRVVIEVKTIEGLKRSVEWLRRRGYL